MTAMKTATLALGLAAALALPAFTARAAALPEFGPSVQFDPAGPQPTAAKLKGKAVILLFFQSWCGICNGWSGELIKQIQDAHGTNKTVVLLALKTDGGGLAGAKGYMESKGANLGQWIIGSDKDAKYYVSVTGSDALWFYVLVGADGTIVERGKAGVSHTAFVGPDKKTEKRYLLSEPAILKNCGALTTVLPTDKSYAPSVNNLARMAELGDAEKALALCAGLLVKPKEKAAAAELLADLQPVVEKRVGDRAALLGDAAAASGARFAAYNELALMQKDFKTHALASKITPALTKARSDPALQKEARADAAYKAVMVRAGRASARDKPRLAKELEALAKQYDGTLAAQQATASAAELASAAESAK